MFDSEEVTGDGNATAARGDSQVPSCAVLKGELCEDDLELTGGPGPENDVFGAVGKCQNPAVVFVGQGRDPAVVSEGLKVTNGPSGATASEEIRYLQIQLQGARLAVEEWKHAYSLLPACALHDQDCCMQLDKQVHELRLAIGSPIAADTVPAKSP